MTEERKTVILFSTDYSEILGMCDRIYVMREGRVVREFKAGEVTREQLIGAVVGGTGAGAGVRGDSS
jgi:putative multiple sugar transport system ATP-binding protein